MGLSSDHSSEYLFGAIWVSILQWRAKIGILNAKLVKYPFKSKYRVNVSSKFKQILHLLHVLLLLVCSGDIELKLGPRKNKTS